jgi:predicted TIM-barrel fold metal-dependent hydrolase
MKKEKKTKNTNKAELDHSCRFTYFLGLAVGTLLVTTTAFQAPVEFTIVDAHEHIESIDKADTLIAANDKLGIKKTILLPTPEETLSLNGRQSFTYYKENTDIIFQIAEKYPKRFIPFCTIDPQDPDALEYLKECHQRGGMGLKLYNGHSYYYNIFQMPLDAPDMMAIYDYAEENRLPVIYHVNITKFGNELQNVLKEHPDLVVAVPHFMVSSIHLDLVSDLLDEFPNLYTDVSFGSPQFLAAGFRRISRSPGKYANFVNKYSDRILFGADMVLTDAGRKDETFMQETLQCYKDLLEQRRFTCKPVTDYYSTILSQHQDRYNACEPKGGDYCNELKEKMDLYQERFDQVEELNGLNLTTSDLRDIYEKNPADFLNIVLISQKNDTTTLNADMSGSEEITEEVTEDGTEETTEAPEPPSDQTQ